MELNRTYGLYEYEFDKLQGTNKSPQTLYMDPGQYIGPRKNMKHVQYMDPGQYVEYNTKEVKKQKGNCTRASQSAPGPLQGWFSFCSGCRRAEKLQEKENNELNDLYGTYYRGVEYNTATDNNPRYNEDGGDAVVTDANADYYQLTSFNDHKPRSNQMGGKNGSTSPNGNNYSQL